MITNFSLDEDFFTSAGLNNENLSAIHDFITRSWIDHGVLILPKNGRRDLLNLIEKLPLKYKQRWLTAAEYGKSSELNTSWWNFSSFENFADSCSLSKQFKTAFSNDETCFVLSGGVDCKAHCSQTGFEMLGAGLCSESINFQNSLNLSRSDIFGHTSAEHVWVDRFEPLAKFSKKITIIDRYFFQNTWESAQRKDKESSMKNFFTFLSKMGKKYHVKIISYGDIKNSEFHTGIYDFFYKSIIKSPALYQALESWELISAQESFFQGESHDRLMGFDRHICQVGNGMRIFGLPPFPRSTFTARYDHNSEIPQRETALRKKLLWRECSD
ncbi:hypothetical protein VUJ49_10920 [Pseudomonas berkeleyensis]|uniref:Uncharacterized protein n=1 Tax=Pseudomonas berkeleyensis TaxID=2726956 RepID=A0A7G5DUV1_9PSED|nr:hypothetical protein [Pseudomonas berkeleyensis]QMV65526.1 hypothetical protein HS968_10885 [Pseudomonas berkeleyensis]WSO41006.1 hypothetical protein VUJ49_10920 [Pseudomonas berkeleyensis]